MVSLLEQFQHMFSEPVSTTRPQNKKHDPLYLLLKRSIIVESGCWEWQGKPDKGYSRVGKDIIYGHRLSYERFIGPIPAGFDVHHKCENKICVNPNHLIAESHEDHIHHNHQKEFCLHGHNNWIQRYKNGKMNGRSCIDCGRERDKRRSKKYREENPNFWI